MCVSITLFFFLDFSYLDVKLSTECNDFGCVGMDLVNEVVLNCTGALLQRLGMG